MVNWIENSITAKGISNLDIFTNGCLDFNKIIPEPIVEEDCPENCLFKEDNEEQILPSDDKPWFNWMKWRNKHWYTSANAADTKINGDCIIFDTDETAPYYIIAKISKMLGDVELTHETLDADQITFILKTVWRNGKMVKAYKADFDWDNEKREDYREIETTPQYDCE